MKPHKDSPVGILDSGLGGISIWSEIVCAMPQENVIYWADNANCPYGGKSRQEIIRLVSAGVEEFISRGVKIIVVACNTATTAAIDYLREQWPEVPFIGLEPAIKPAAQASQSKVVGVLATKYTVDSDMFRKTRDQYAQGIRVIATAGEGLVELVENGQEEGPQAEQLLRHYIEPMLDQGADQLVLACTHFPLLMPAIRRIIADRPMSVIDPARAIARHTRQVRQQKQLLKEEGPQGERIVVSTAGQQYSRKLESRSNRDMNAVRGK